MIALVEKRASDAFSAVEAQQLINKGADITVRVRDQTMSMIACVREEARRGEAAGLFRAQYCVRLAQVLQDHASELLGQIVLSTEGPDFKQIESLAAIEASYYQEAKYGPLGLLGHLLQQQQIPIRDDVVRFLIEHDPKVRYSLTMADEQKETCLSLARKNESCPQQVRENLQRTLDLLLVRAAFDHPSVEASEITQWVARGANIEAVDEQRNTALINAIKEDDYKLVCVLVAAGCDVNKEGLDHKKPIQIAKELTKRNARLIALLETKNVNADLKRLIETKRSRLTVHAVAERLAQGANINAPIANNSTFLHLLIANHGSPDLLTAFVNDFNADLFAMDLDGHRSIEMCILYDSSPCKLLQTLLKLPKVNTDLFFNPKLNKSILQFAQEKEKPEAVKIIQADLNLRLWSVVLRATSKDESNQRLESEVKLLLNYQAEIDHQHNEKDYDRWTVLHLACKTATKSFVQFLIQECHADPDLATGKGDRPISVATEFGQQPMIEYFNEQLGLSLNVSNKERQTPLHLAARSGHLNVIRYLVRWGADHRAKNVSRQSPLDLARSNATQVGPNLVERKSLLLFLERLTCPPLERSDPNERAAVVPSFDLDICELPEPPQMEPLAGKEEKALKTRGFFSKAPNDMLHDAAMSGRVEDMEVAIQQGADICWKRNEMSVYKIASLSMEDYQRKASAPGVNVTDLHRYQRICNGCQKIMQRVQQMAQSALTDAIKKADAREAIAYLEAGAPVTTDLLYFVCTTTDDVRILSYLSQYYAELRQALIDYTTADSPYRLAKQKNHVRTASYIKYTLSVECATAVAANNVEYVKKLIRAGASADMPSVSNLDVALAHQNPELVRVLCDAGARMNKEWFQSNSLSLPLDVTERLHPAIAFQMNRSFINHQLRYAAAAGDWEMFQECIQHGADINSENCHGSTALLCSIQHGNHFRIVHTLLSRGATILHSNLTEPISLVDLAEQHHFKQIAEYMSKELNRQFLTSILNNDEKSAERFEALGADFNCQDEQGRTPLHYAVQYHGLELASWLTDRGSTPMRADQEGTYPIHEAVQKGMCSTSKGKDSLFPASR